MFFARRNVVATAVLLALVNRPVFRGGQLV